VRAGAAVSTHPVAAIATGEAAGQLLERGFDVPDLLCCFVTSAHAGALEDIVAALRAVLSPAVVLGAASAGVVAHARLVDQGPGLVLWAADVGPSVPIRLAPNGGGDVPADASGLILLVDPAYAAGAPFRRWLSGTRRDLAIAGTLVTPARAAGGSVLALNGRLQGDGAVGVALGPASGFAATICAGTRPIGPELTVTSASGAMIYELDHMPARQRLERLARHELPATDIAFINDGLLLQVARGVPACTYLVAGADSVSGALALGPSSASDGDTTQDSWEVRPGAVVRFAVHDRASEASELRRVLAQPALNGALVFPGGAAALAVRPPVVADAPGAATIAGCQGNAALGWLGSSRGVHDRGAAVACFYDEAGHPGNGGMANR
jgi:small ligand-binding sensory domain FIST